jgi:hypothetical protein
MNGRGFSVQTAPGLSVEAWARGGRFPNRQISVATVGALETAGPPVVGPTPGDGDHHGTVLVRVDATSETFEALSRCFSPWPNPFPVIWDKSND